jgi:hypothetical protein
MNHYCDIWFWRASDQEAVARHLTDRTRITGEPDTRRRAGLVRSALLSILRTAGLTEQPVQASPVEQEETPVRESCGCVVRRSSSTGRLYSTRDSGFSHAVIGAAEEAVAGEEDMITLGDSTDKNLVDRKIMVTHYYQESLVIRQSGK